MKAHYRFALIIAAVAVASPTLAAERYKLRAPGGVPTSVVNEVGVWKTANAARRARSSLDGMFTSPNLECIVRPGTKADVIKREGPVAYVRASNAAFGGCRGYVKADFLSAN